MLEPNGQSPAKDRRSRLLEVGADSGGGAHASILPLDLDTKRYVQYLCPG